MLSVLADIFIEICGGKIQNTYRNVCQMRAALFGLSTLICLFTYEVLSKVMDLIGGTGVMLTSFILPIACYLILILAQLELILKPSWPHSGSSWGP